MNEIIISERMPVLALRGLTAFPQATMHFDVGREKSVRALDKAMAGDQRILLITQKDILQDDPDFKDLYSIGTVAHVRQVLKMPGDSVRVLVFGEYRARITETVQKSPYLLARTESVPDADYVAGTTKIEALKRQAIQLFEDFTELSQRPVQEYMLRILATNQPGLIADLI